MFRVVGTFGGIGSPFGQQYGLNSFSNSESFRIAAFRVSSSLLIYSRFLYIFIEAILNYSSSLKNFLNL